MAKKKTTPAVTTEVSSEEVNPEMLKELSDNRGEDEEHE